MDINITNPVTASKIGEVVNGAASATPNDTDLVMSVESSVAKKNTWTQVKAFLKTYFDSIYQAAGSYLTSANITQTITNGVTDKAPSEDSVFDALALKQTISTNIFYMSGSQGALANPADGVTYYFMPRATAITLSTGANVNRFYFPEDNLTLVYCSVTFIQTPGSNEQSTLNLRLNNTTDIEVSSVITNDTNITHFENDALSISGSRTDYLEFKWVCPVWTSNPTSVTCSWKVGFKRA